MPGAGADVSMRSLPEGYRAIVVGASGGIGQAMVAHLRADPRCGHVEALHRRSAIPIDVGDEASIAAAAAALAGEPSFHLMLLATGVLHGPGWMPEKRIADLDMAQMLESFRINAIGPALVLRSFSSLLARDRALVAVLSAKVGSIGDNRLGGWYGYRASKAALNMLVRTASIEWRRTAPEAIVVALHPGTVDTALSRPFGGATRGRDPATAAAEMLTVVDGLAAADSGCFVAYDGERLPW